MLARVLAENNKAQDRANRGICEPGTPVWENGGRRSLGGRINNPWEPEPWVGRSLKEVFPMALTGLTRLGTYRPVTLTRDAASIWSTRV